MNIDKDTLLFGSFAKKAGNNGCKMFNAAFSYHRLNAIYKSFSVNNIEKAVNSARTLNFNGFAITMPFKEDVLEYVEEWSDDVREIDSANTIINDNGYLTAYNTDYLSAHSILSEHSDFDTLYVLGNGGYSKSVVYAAKKLGMSVEQITRKNWSDIRDLKSNLIYNCTPVENIDVDKSNTFIDCIVTTETGYKLSLIQASHQFKLYTGLDFPFYNKK